MTPEGEVKAKINAILERYKPLVWWHMAVLGGYGKPTLDYTGCCVGLFFSIEAKAEWKKLTVLQNRTKKDMQAAQGRVFEIRALEDEEGFRSLENWLNYHVLAQRFSGATNAIPD